MNNNEYSNFDFQGEELNYCVYAHINKVNGKMYIGITCDVNNRWHPSSYKGSTKFYEAIEEFGWDNFEHVVLIEGITRSMALECETALIKKYKTQYEEGNGYNILVSLEELRKIQIKTNKNSKQNGVPVYQYSLQGKFIKKWNSIREAARSLGIDHTMIIAMCKNKRTYFLNMEYQWSYEYKEKLPPFENTQKSIWSRKATGPIVQLDFSGNIIAEYDDVYDYTSKGSLVDNIKRCLRLEALSANGYLWAKKEDISDDYIKELVKRKQEARFNSAVKHGDKEVLQYDLNGVLLNRYKNNKEAAEAVGVSIDSIRRATRKHTLSNNYQWRYEGDEPPQKIQTRSNSVIQIDINTNQIIGKYESIFKASTIVANCKNGSNIANCCRGKRNTAYGYKWEYYDPEKHDISHLEVR